MDRRKFIRNLKDDVSPDETLSQSERRKFLPHPTNEQDPHRENVPTMTRPSENCWHAQFFEGSSWANINDILFVLGSVPIAIIAPQQPSYPLSKTQGLEPQATRQWL